MSDLTKDPNFVTRDELMHQTVELFEEILHLRTVLRGIASCSTCEMCQAAARSATAEQAGGDRQ